MDNQNLSNKMQKRSSKDRNKLKLMKSRNKELVRDAGMNPKKVMNPPKLS